MEGTFNVVFGIIVLTLSLKVGRKEGEAGMDNRP